MCLAKGYCQVVCTIALSVIIIRIDTNLIKPAFRGVYLNIEEESLDKIDEVVVVDHFESTTFITRILTVHKALVKEEHCVGVAGRSDGFLAETPVPSLQILEI